jgi:phage recombination protein Bet
MSTALATQAGGALALSEEELIGVLTSSLYPGANIASIKMVLGYCKAAGLDPMQKPVHIVPMWDGKAKQMRDVVMPGVGLYRTQASRTGTFAGQSEPEFGPMVTARLGGVEITYPEFAKVTVKKTMANGTVADFTAVEYWIENYAVKGGQEKSVAPNAMWMKRPRGQIAKCAAAQALRLAFPEMGAQPTAEEMEGKSLQDDAPAAHAAPEVPAELIRAADEAAVKGVAAYQAFWSEAGPASRKLLAAGHEMRKGLAAKADADRTVDAEPAEEVQA